VGALRPSVTTVLIVHHPKTALLPQTIASQSACRYVGIKPPKCVVLGKKTDMELAVAQRDGWRNIASYPQNRFRSSSGLPLERHRLED
jgi:hypothetical protein